MSDAIAVAARLLTATFWRADIILSSPWIVGSLTKKHPLSSSTAQYQNDAHGDEAMGCDYAQGDWRVLP